MFLHELPADIQAWVATAPPVTANAISVMEKRYFEKADDQTLLEDVDGMYWRTGGVMAEAERVWGADDTQVHAMREQFFKAMRGREFLPNSPTLANAGIRTGMLSACFVLPVEDDLEGIFDTVKHAALIHQGGGGTGFAFSRLRPKNDLVHSSKGCSSGPVSFMLVFNAATEAIKQGSMRRGANMGVLRVDSPDIIEFIDLKSDLTKLNNFNVSVAITDVFLTALQAEDDRYNLVNPRTGAVAGQLHARAVWQHIGERAHTTGEPGLIFIDRMNMDNPMPELGDYESVNPCGEKPLIPYDSCNLGSITLDQFVVPNAAGVYEVNWQGLKHASAIGTRFLDNVLDVNAYVPKVPQIRKTALITRNIGLGVMGLARALFKLGLAYDSPEGREMAAALYAFIDAESKKASVELAHARGAYLYFKDHWDASVAFHQQLWAKRVGYAQEYLANTVGNPTLIGVWQHIVCTLSQCVTAVGQYGLRNSTTMTIAPTGTLSVFHDTTGGCEPVFGLVFSRFQADLEMLDGEPEFVKALEALPPGTRDNVLATVAKCDGSLTQALAAVEASGANALAALPSGLWSDLAKVFVTAGDVSPANHVLMQAALQRFNDSAVSKTINLPATATVQDVLDAYNLAVETNCKGITVYRDGSRSFQPLTAGTKSSKQLEAEKTIDQTIQTSDNEAGSANDEPIAAETEEPPMATSTAGPRPRPEDLYGFTRTTNTGNGKLMTTLNYDAQGLREVLLTIGRSGGTINSLAEAIGRLASLALQHGAPQDAVAATLIGIRSADPAGFGDKQVLSIPDGLGKVLKSAPRTFGSMTMPAKFELAATVPMTTPRDETHEAVNVFGQSPECPDCSASMAYAEGCAKCTDPSCSYSKCG